MKMHRPLINGQDWDDAPIGFPINFTLSPDLKQSVEGLFSPLVDVHPRQADLGPPGSAGKGLEREPEIAYHFGFQRMTYGSTLLIET